MTAFENKILEVPKLGEGIYTTRDVAEVLKLPYHKVKYLMNTFWQSYTFGSEGNKAVNFFALLEFYTYYHLRENGVTSGTIKNFHNKLSKDLKTIYPFASIKVHTPKERKKKTQIWFDYMGELMKGDGKLQPSIRSFIEPFLNQIEFGSDLLAKRFYPITNSRNVVVDPKHQFGQPVISGTNLQIKTINFLIKAGETKRNVCLLYDINEDQVNDAISYYTKAA